MRPTLPLACFLAVCLSACTGGPGLPDTSLADVGGGGGDGGGGGGGGGPGGAGQTTDPDAPLAAPVWPALQNELEPLALAFDDATAAIVYQLWSKEYAPGRFLLHGRWYDVSLRQRGDGSQLHPKHSWKVKHPKGVSVDGQSTRNYLAEWPDGGYLSDPFSYALMGGAAVPTPRARYVTLDVNGEHQGIYVEVEEPDKKSFLVRNGIDPEANVYRCGLRDCELKLGPRATYQGDWEKKTNESESSDDLQAFLVGLSRTPEHEIEAWLERHVDLPRFVRFYAVAILISLSGIDDSGSYLVHDRVRDRWIWVPWDLNNAKLVFWRDNPPEWGVPYRYDLPTYTLYDSATLGVAAGKEQRYGGAHPPFVVLFQRIWDRPALRNRILDEVEAMLDGVFSAAETGARIDALHALIADALTRDPWVSPEHAAASVQVLKDYVRRRSEYLRAQIPLERRRGEGGLVVNAIAPDAVELYNREDTPRDLGGLALTDDLRDRLKVPLPAGTVVPAHGTLRLPFTAAGQGGEVGLFDLATRMPLDALYYAAPQGRTYARIPDGAESWGWR
jgi:spore coat protein H